MAANVTAILTTHTDRRLPALRRALASLPAAVPAVVVVPRADLTPPADAHTDLRVLVSEDADSLSAARNVGAEAASGRYYAFLDDDVECMATWWPAVQRHTARAVVACGGPAVPAFPSVRPAHLPRRFDWLVGCGPYFTEQRRVRNTYGCNLVVRADAFAAVGGFDPTLGKAGDLGQGEEVRLCKAVAAWAGERVQYDPALAVRHHIDPAQLRVGHLVRRAYHQGATKATLGVDDAERGFLKAALADLRESTPTAAAASLAYMAATGVGYLTAKVGVS